MAPREIAHQEGRPGGEELALLIDEGGNAVGRRSGRGLSEGEVDAKVEGGAGMGKLGRLVEGIARGQQTGAGHHPVVEGLDHAAVHGLAEAEVVGVDDETGGADGVRVAQRPVAPHLAENAQDDLVSGGGRDTGDAGVVLNADLSDASAQAARLDQDFGVDERPLGAEPHLLEQRTADELECKVHVPDVQAEGPADKVVVGPGHDLPAGPFGPAEAIADEQIAIGRELSDGLPRIVSGDREIRVHVEN